MRYGFIGLGNLGKHLAANLAPRRLRGGRPRPAARRRRRRRWRPAHIGRSRSPSSLQIMRLPDHLPALARRPPRRCWTQALPAMRPGSTWIEMSTNDFAEVEALAARAPELGHRHPRLPGDGRRASRRGGRYHRFSWRRATSVRDARAGAQGHGRAASFILGGIEQAAVTKVVTNMLAFIHLIAAGEALMLCAKARRRSARGVRCHRREFGQQLRPRDREPGHSQWQL